MSLRTTLNNLFIDGYREEYAKVYNFYELHVLMDKTRDIKVILSYLRLELEGKNRPSYVSRIYGRYRKMLPIHDREVLNSWGTDLGKGRE